MTFDELDEKLEEVEKRKIIVKGVLPAELCPLCRGTLTEMSVPKEIEYAPPYHVRGYPLPKMTKWVTMITCNDCEYAEET